MTKTSQPSRSRRCATRLARAFVALAIMSGAGVVAGNAAEAAPFITVVLHPIEVSPGICKVLVGVDINMTEADARDFIAHPGQEATAQLWGDDPVYDDALPSVPVAQGWPQAWAGGYSVEYKRQYGCSQLDEDWEGGDEIYAQITFDDFRTGTRHVVNSGVVHVNL